MSLSNTRNPCFAMAPPLLLPQDGLKLRAEAVLLLRVGALGELEIQLRELDALRLEALDLRRHLGARDEVVVGRLDLPGQVLALAAEQPVDEQLGGVGVGSIL